LKSCSKNVSCISIGSIGSSYFSVQVDVPSSHHEYDPTYIIRLDFLGQTVKIQLAKIYIYRFVLLILYVPTNKKGVQAISHLLIFITLVTDV